MTLAQGTKRYNCISANENALSWITGNHIYASFDQWTYLTIKFSSGQRCDSIYKNESTFNLFAKLFHGLLRAVWPLEILDVHLIEANDALGSISQEFTLI